MFTRTLHTCPALSHFCLKIQEVFNYKIAARPERRRQFEKELTSQMTIALDILTACLKINELKEQVGTFCFFL
uniref:Transportin-3-like n=1 Tax=Rhizophora mucronata TaxID=61149 RepID=A0A2P2MLR9_RHIMU